MKTLLLPLLVLTAAFNPLLLQADESAAAGYENQVPNFPFEYSWTGNEEDLYFYMELPEGISFPDSYSIHSYENGQGCEIVCVVDEKNALSNEESQLQEMVIYVEVRNTEDSNALSFEIESHVSYVENGWVLNSVKTYKSRNFGTLNTPSINLEEAPSFTTFSDKPNAGVFTFKNAQM